MPLVPPRAQVSGDADVSEKGALKIWGAANLALSTGRDSTLCALRF